MSVTIQITFLVEEIPHYLSFPHLPVVDLFILIDIQLQTIVDNFVLHVLVRM